MYHLNSLRKYLPALLAWFSLALILLVLVPMAYPVKLPLVYHIYHLILFCILIGVYYLNVNLLIPVIYKKYRIFSYLGSVIIIGLMTILFMNAIENMLHIRELIHQKLNPDKPYVHKRNIFVYLYLSILLAFILLSGIMMQLVRKWNLEERNNSILREEKAKAELMTLKAQIHPHFFFNTLNTIYALSHSDVPQSQEALLKLSKMMRFAMNEENRERVKLQEEMDFIKNYLDLMSYRLPANVGLKTDIEDIESPVEIVPMILLTFIENCFKHGITTEKPCKIKIKTQMSGTTFILQTQNDIFESKSAAPESSGIGIANTLRRLDILYPLNYNYRSHKEDLTYDCELQINLK